MAGSHFMNGDFDKALHVITNALADVGENEFLHLNMASALFELQLYRYHVHYRQIPLAEVIHSRMPYNRKAIKSCELAISLNPYCLRAYLILIRSLCSVGRQQEAYDELSRALTLAGSAEAAHKCDLTIGREIAGLKHSLFDTEPKSSINKDDFRLPSKTLALLHDRFVSSGNQDLVRDVRENMLHRTKNNIVDDLVAFGYIQVNSGDVETAIVVFSALLEFRCDIFSAHVGLGTALAMSGQFSAAEEHFSWAIEIDPVAAEVFARRGQTRAILNRATEALSDLSQSIHLQDSAENRFQRGLLYHQMKIYPLALMDLRRAEASGYALRQAPQRAQLYNFIGICEGQLGNVDESIKAHRQALELDPSFLEAHLNMAEMYKEHGENDAAEQCFQRIFKSHPITGVAQVHSNYAAFLYAIGRPELCLLECDVALSVTQSQDQDMAATIHRIQSIAASALLSLGRFSEAIERLSEILKNDRYNFAGSQQEAAKWMWAHSDSLFRSYSIDAALDGSEKECWCKKLPRDNHLLCMGSLSVPVSQTNDALDIDPAKYTDLCVNTKPLRCWAQLRCRGFLPNVRQHSMFGVGVLELAQTLRKHMELKKMDDSKGLMLPDAGSSDPRHSLNSRDKKKKCHPFSWRDFFDIAVRWRQVVEPNDPVFWIDRFPKESFSNGFGLQTPLINGHFKTIRYYSYFPMAFALMKKIIVEDGYCNADGTRYRLSAVTQRAALDTDTLYELYRIVGRDFYVVKTCIGLLGPKQRPAAMAMEGTRLTVVFEQATGGFEFAIRTPGTPDRWALFDAELEYAFNMLLDSCDICLYHSVSHSSGATDAPAEDIEAVLRAALTVYYFWINFAPLSRGTAMCGCMTLLSSMLSIGAWLDSDQFPAEKQLDWEAIFAPNCQEFIARVSPWLRVCPSPVDIGAAVDVSVAIQTFRHAMEFIIFSS